MKFIFQKYLVREQFSEKLKTRFLNDRQVKFTPPPAPPKKERPGGNSVWMKKNTFPILFSVN